MNKFSTNSLMMILFLQSMQIETQGSLYLAVHQICLRN